jgi:NADH:ubiquinone oxidoreductase subunit 6 (subunit J)
MNIAIVLFCFMSALGVILSKRIISTAIFSFLFLISISCITILMDVELLAGIQVIVFIVISILITLASLMLENVIRAVEFIKRKRWPLICAFLLFSSVGILLLKYFNINEINIWEDLTMKKIEPLFVESLFSNYIVSFVFIAIMIFSGIVTVLLFNDGEYEEVV